MDKDSQKVVQINSYSKVWRIEHKIFAIQNLVLPVPVIPSQLLYFITIFAIMFILSQKVAFINNMASTIKFIAIPFGLTKFFMQKLLDGKNPIRFFIDYVHYLFVKGFRIERVHKIDKKIDETIKINWNMTKRDKLY